MTYGDGDGVGRIGRPWQLFERQYAGDHGADLRLVRTPITGDCGFDFARRVQRDGQPGTGRRDSGDSARLCGAHDSADVVLAEHSLDRDDFGFELVDCRYDRFLDGKKSLA